MVVGLVVDSVGVVLGGAIGGVAVVKEPVATVETESIVVAIMEEVVVSGGCGFREEATS